MGYSMKCEFGFCIYNRDFLCILKGIQLNSLGMCEDCIIVSIDDDAFKKLKESRLEEIDSRCEDYD